MVAVMPWLPGILACLMLITHRLLFETDIHNMPKPTWLAYVTI